MTNINKFIQEVTWDDVAKQVANLNPGLAQEINNLSPSQDYTLYKIRYPYGAEILQKGIFHIPDDQGNILPIADAKIPQKTKAALLYNFNSNPVGMVLSNSAELYLTLSDRIVPYMVVEPGHLLGVWGVLDNSISHHPISIWDMSAGSRSCFMLPRITESVAHHRLLRQLQVQVDLPKKLTDHWYVFREIANYSGVTDKWEMEILYFSKKWFTNIQDKQLCSLRYFLQNSIWENTSFLRNQAFWNLIFSVIREQSDIPPNAYVNDIIKNLFAIGVGAASGFAPAIDNTVAPIELIQNTYVNGAYKLKNYAPIIMTSHLHNRNHDNYRPVYFSSSYSTALEFSPKSNKRPSLIKELFTIQDILQKYIKGILQGKLDISTTPIYKAAEELSFYFYHENPSQYKKTIRSNSQIPLEDKSFYHILANTNNTEFPSSSEFIRGCIRISRINNI